MPQSNTPLVVDLDGTLIRTDLLLESFYAMIKTHPWSIFLIPAWLLKGKAYLKSRIAERAHIDAKTLPYQQEFLNYLRAESSKGRKLVLATASVKKFADAIASHLGIFTDVFASDEHSNLSGKRKLKVLIDRYGDKNFDYAGNDTPDLHIFLHARRAILVNPSTIVLSAAKINSDVEHVFKDAPAGLFVYIKAIRFYQWIKNVLLFIPLITSHEWTNTTSVSHVLLGFVSFGLCASSGYLFNDLLDLSSDRNHPRKKNRPMASGALSIGNASILLVALQLAGLGLAAMIDIQFCILLIIYYLASLAYTLHLKTYVLIDVLVLAGFYTARIVAGSMLAGVELSFWLFAFSIFIFFSLALVKRCSELTMLMNLKSEYAGGRDYSTSDLEYLREMGIASGYMAILIFALYINSTDVLIRYTHPKILWMICPALFYWISRVWLKTGRGEMHDDPIVYSINDKGTQFVALGIAIVILLAI